MRKRASIPNYGAKLKRGEDECLHLIIKPEHAPSLLKLLEVNKVVHMGKLSEDGVLTIDFGPDVADDSLKTILARWANQQRPGV